MSDLTKQYADRVEDLARRMHDVAQRMRLDGISATYAHGYLHSCRVTLNGIVQEMMIKYYQEESPARAKD